MPLFGKKKKEEKKSPDNYTQQGNAYPTAPQVSGPSGPPHNAPPYGAQAPPAPPPYSAAGYAPAPYAGAQPAAGPQYGPPPGYQYGAHQPGQAPTVVVQGGFDAGARFDLSRPNVPPPPPGCPPNAAQMAMMQGANVVVTQKKDNFWTGGSDGGYTWW